jgi:transcriptional regulator, AraC family
MKVFPFTIPKSKRDSLILQEDKGPSFYEMLHQHKEIQISYIVEGEGSLIVGDSVNFYSKGDVVVLGENVPHVFKSNLSKSDHSRMFTLFFTRSSFGDGLFEIDELSALRSFFNKAENGFAVNSNRSKIRSLIQEIHTDSKIDRFIKFFHLLKLINRSNTSSLSTYVPSKKYSDNEGRRMSAVYEYTMNNFQYEIRLETISAIAAMTKNAFCKYFKKRTNKTFITFLNEIRIEESCNQMQSNKEISIADIAEMSGFQNISNFNRRFKNYKGKTPREFKRSLNYRY